MPDVDGVPECIKCGACCFSTNERYLRVAGIDHERLGDDAERLTRFIGNRLYMKMVDGRCAAHVYHPKREEFLCSIYERRPDVCHWLERGTGQCAAERHEKAERRLFVIRRCRGDSDTTTVI